MKIAIAGKMGSGKSYVASQIMNRFPGFYKTSFAKKIKEIAQDLFQMREKDRTLLITIAETMKQIDSEVWIRQVTGEVEEKSSVILDDLRFHNEYRKLKEEGWFIVLVRESNDVRMKRLEKLYPETITSHISSMNSHTENEVSEYPDNYFDCVVENGKLDNLFEKITI